MMAYDVSQTTRDDFGKFIYCLCVVLSSSLSFLFISPLHSLSLSLSLYLSISLSLYLSIYLHLSLSLSLSLFIYLSIYLSKEHF